MRIISWNCCMAFRNKMDSVRLLKPDISVIQEVSRNDIESFDAPFVHWVGRLQSKGMGIIGHRTGTYSIDPAYDSQLPWFVPLIVDDLHILAVWACAISNARRYVRLVHEAIDLYDPFLRSEKAIAIGDFNSNAVFDRKHKAKSHTLLVERLAEMGLTSEYHHQTSENHGDESVPTFYLYRAPDKPYHFDYAFISQTLQSGAKLGVGLPGHFLTKSDHMPLILDIQANGRQIALPPGECPAVNLSGR